MIDGANIENVIMDQVVQVQYTIMDHVVQGLVETESGQRRKEKIVPDVVSDGQTGLCKTV